MAQPTVKLPAEESAALEEENAALRAEVERLQQQQTAIMAASQPAPPALPGEDSGDPTPPDPPPQGSGSQIQVAVPDRAPPPGRLDVAVDRGVDAWLAWKQRWDDYALLTNLAASPRPVQLARLRASLADDTLRIVRNLGLSGAQMTVTSVLEKLRLYFLGQVNEVVERRNFNTRSQRDGESFEDFFVALQELSATCNFCAQCRDSLTRDRIVVGLRDPAVIKKLCATPRLTLAAAVSVCRAEEAADRDVTAIVGEDGAVAARRVTRAARSTRPPPPPRGRRPGSPPLGAESAELPPRRAGSAALTPPPPPPPPAGDESACVGCGLVHRVPGVCPARGRRCGRCGALGHFRAVCRGRRASGEARGSASYPTASAVIASTQRGGAPRISLVVTARFLPPVTVSALPDSGADITVAGLDFLDLIGGHVNNLLDSPERPRAADGRSIHTFGMLPARMQLGDATTRDDIHFLQGVAGLLLSWKAARALRVLPEAYPAQLPAACAVTSAVSPAARRRSRAPRVKCVTPSAGSPPAPQAPLTVQRVMPAVVPSSGPSEEPSVQRAVPAVVPSSGPSEEPFARRCTIQDQVPLLPDCSRLPSGPPPGAGPASLLPPPPATCAAPAGALNALSPAAARPPPVSPAVARMATAPALAPSSVATSTTSAAPPASSGISADPAADAVLSEFADVFDGVIRVMPGEEFEIRLRPDATPFAVSAPRRVPFALREPLLRELQRLEADSIITPVTEPTEWCAPIVVSQKKNGAGVRLCVDLSRLNHSVRREFYPSSTPLECVTCIISEEARYFAVFDALKGYHQCPLEPLSQPLTTFITPFGRFMYKRAPYGISSISEHYNRRMDQCLQDLHGMKRLVDDVIIYGRTRDELLQRVRLFL